MKRTIGVIPTPALYLVGHCLHRDSETVITFGWRVALEENALGLLFQSIEGMSHIVGVGFEFAKVLVVPTSLEVEIVDIGQAKWDVIWQVTSNNKHHGLNIVSIVGVNKEGEKHENARNIECLTTKQSGTKHGVGLLHPCHTTHVISIDAEPKSDRPCMFDVVVEYFLLQKVMDVMMDKQCDGDGGAKSNCGGWNGIKQDIRGASNSQSILSLFKNYLSLQGQHNSTNDDDSDGILLPRK